MQPGDMIRGGERPSPSHATASRWQALGGGVIAAAAIPDFRILLFGTSAWFLASQMLNVAQGYLAFLLAGSAMAVGVVNFSVGISMAPLSLIGGAIADRVDKRTIAMAMQSLMGISAFAVAVLIATGRIELWHLAASGLVQGIVFAFIVPARQSMVPELVGKALLGNAIAVVSMGQNLSRIAGPAVGGMLVALPAFGVTGTFFVIAAIYLSVTAFTWQLPSFPPPGQSRETLLISILSGVRYLGRDRSLLVLFGMAFIATMFGLPYQLLLPVFSARVLGVGAEGLGLLYAATGAGALCGAVGVARIKNPASKTVLQILFGMLFGVTLVAFALTADMRLSLVLIFLNGVFSQCYFTLNNVLIVMNTSRDFFGRMIAMYQLTWACVPFAVVPISALADVIGIAQTFVTSGVLVTGVLAVIWVFDLGKQRTGVPQSGPLLR